MCGASSGMRVLMRKRETERQRERQRERERQRKRQRQREISPKRSWRYALRQIM